MFILETPIIESSFKNISVLNDEIIFLYDKFSEFSSSKV